MANSQKHRSPAKRERIAGVTVTVQTCNHRDYTHTVVLHAHGKRKVRYCRSIGEAKSLAQSWSIETANHGTKHGTVVDEERAAIIMFRDAVSRLPEPRPTLLDAVTSYLESIKRQLKQITVHELIELRVKQLQTKQRHERTIRDLVGADGKGGRLGLFAREFGDREAATITPEEIEGWSMDVATTEATRREILVRLHGLFAAGKNYITKNPVEDIDRPPPNATRATILTPDEASRLLAAMPARSLPALAFQLFAGIRRAEIGRLKWQDVDYARMTIRVTQRKGTGKKREQARIVPMHHTLVEWTKAHRQPAGWIMTEGRTAGMVSDTIYKDDFAAARSAAGLIGAWDENTLRHCFGSHEYARTGDLARCMSAMGHTNAQTFLEFYNNAVSEATAEEFWSILPPSKSKIVSMPSKAV